MIARALPSVLTTAFLLSAEMAGAAPFLRLDTPSGRGVLAAGVELTRDAELRIEAVGLSERAPAFSLWPFSFYRNPEEERGFLIRAWLLDGATRKPVWVMDEHGTSPVPGSPRLRRADSTVRLAPGRYELYLSSTVEPPPERDSNPSRTQPLWNRAIDYFSGSEPEQLFGECFASLSTGSNPAVELRRYEVTGDLPEALIRLNRLGDSELRRAGFELRRAAALRLYGIVEHVRSSDEAADFGWIIEASTRRVVWQSWEGDRPQAGGGAKNRLIDETVRLEAGRYILSYGTDDSHAFPKFNTSPPLDPFNWGITMSPSDGFDPATFSRFEPTEPEPLAALTEVGDSEWIEQPFRLERDTELHVRALGERMDEERLADFAAIVEADTGRTVWEMKTPDTIPAGGAQKNRLFDRLVALPRGDYVLGYRSDDSHSYPQWNASPPFAPRAWGVAVYPTPGAGRPAFEIRGAARRRAERVKAH